MKNEKKSNKYIGLLVGVLIIALGLVWWQFSASALEFSEDTELATLDIPAGQTIVLKDGAKLTISGDASIDGNIKCKEGPLPLVVEGNLKVNGKIECIRDDDIGDSGNGINIVVGDEVLFGDDSVIETNGNVQLVDDISKLATTDEQIESIFNDTAEDTGEGFRIGPMIEIPLNEGQEASFIRSNKVIRKDGLAWKIQDLLTETAKAVEPAEDIDGDEVDNAVRIGGRWIVGHPSRTPPGVIDIPTPPKKIKKIIVAFNFGRRNMQLTNLTLFGPNGRDGAAGKKGCDVTGSDGENAFRLNVQAPSITIGRFDLHLGSGGDGGVAETDKDCDPGIAKGGNGGEAGNFKIRGTNRFQITEYFGIFPGVGGAGGEAIAHGRDGQKPGDKGGDATATGGKGADNKKGAKVTGTVGGLSNVTISQIVGGDGGIATANAGKGGDGKGCKSNGGNGGKAIATGGEAGAATSRSAESVGGDGGDAEANGGIGGEGGDCDPSDDGGNGGIGGDAEATGGVGGTGKTTRGVDGTGVSNGGNGGNGGDGCLPGKGAAGGNGDNPGEKGKEGKNLCILVENPPMTDPPPPEDDLVDPDDGGLDTGGELLALVPTEMVELHLVGTSSCPDVYNLSISGGNGETWHVTGIPEWLDMPSSGEMGEIPFAFNCEIDDYTTHPEKTFLYFSSGDYNYKFPVTITIKGNEPEDDGGDDEEDTEDPDPEDPDPEDPDPEDPEDELLVLAPGELTKEHKIGDSPCPDPFALSVSGGNGEMWHVADVPDWLDIPPSGEMGSVPVSFNCNIKNFSTHTEFANLFFTSGDVAAELPVNVYVTGEE